MNELWDIQSDKTTSHRKLMHFSALVDQDPEIYLVDQIMFDPLKWISAKLCQSSQTAGLHYCCTAKLSLNGDQYTAKFEVNLEKLLKT